MKQFLVSIDQMFNALIYLKGDGWGYADETISARSWRCRDKTNFYKFVNILFFLQNNHCKEAYESEVDRKQLPSEYRK